MGMSASRKFHVPGSPLNGKQVPLDWFLLEPAAKRRALVKCGYASDYASAGRVLGKHGAAIGALRRQKKKDAEERRHPEGND